MKIFYILKKDYRYKKIKLVLIRYFLQLKIDELKLVSKYPGIVKEKAEQFTNIHFNNNQPEKELIYKSNFE